MVEVAGVEPACLIVHHVPRSTDLVDSRESEDPSQ